MLRSDCGRSRCPLAATVGKLAVMLVVLTVAPWAPGAPGKDPVCVQIYQHTYDEVFQGVLEASERNGYPLLDKDKDKGTIVVSRDKHIDFYIHVEPLNTKPETQVTINPKYKGFKLSNQAQREFAENFLRELLKVLSRYR